MFLLQLHGHRVDPLSWAYSATFEIPLPGVVAGLPESDESQEPLGFRFVGGSHTAP